jgi:histidinol dehydrogenase
MQIDLYPERKKWKSLLQRPYVDNSAVVSTVGKILHEVQQNGDEALRKFTYTFDDVSLDTFKVSEQDLRNGERLVPENLKAAILQAKENIETFHKRQIATPEIIETMSGVQCWRKSVGIDRVGLYVPGGSAPLFSTVLMLGIPAQLAGCKEVVLTTPCDKAGQVHPAILYAASIAGISEIYKLGGAQAIAALGYGTETIGAVFKIFGPGNRYVTAAKQLIQMHGVAIDMPAGPSEVCVLADETADPAFVASDLLSQAEHGADSQVLLVSNSASFVKSCLQEIEKQSTQLPRKEIIVKALQHSKAVVVENMNSAIEIVNAYAAEHLIINCEDADSVAERITNAGSVFIGEYSPESAGDYASGTNHTLPTNAFARSYSGVSVDSFVKKITFQKLSKDGLAALAPTIVTMAEAEGLQAHANAVKIRTN